MEQVAIDLIGLSSKIIHLIKLKNDFATNISYQILLLFDALGEIA